MSLDFYSIPIDGLELSVRSFNALRNYREDMSLGILMDMVSSGEIKRVPHLGARSLREVYEMINHLIGDYKSKQQRQDEEMLAFCHQNLDLIRALMKGHAVIIPTTVNRS